MASAASPTIFIVSDGRGDTALRMLKAALVQFEGVRYDVVRKSEVRTPEAVRKAMSEAAGAGAAVFYTLVANETRRELVRCAEELLIPRVDLLGPTMYALHDIFHSSPGSTPGLLYESEKESFDRYDAIDYVLKHDDGQYPHELSQADVVLVGVSRVSKSSTCFYLAYEGIRAANVPLVPGMPPIPELLRTPSERVIGLKHNVLRLARVRKARTATRYADVLHHYHDKKAIAEEVREANALMDRHGWRSIDVSYMAVEEIARRVMSLTGIRRRPLD